MNARRYREGLGGAGCLPTRSVLTTSPEHLGPPPAPRVTRIADACIDWLRTHLPAAGAHRIFVDHGTVSLNALYGPFQQEVGRLMAGRGYRAGADWDSRVFAGAARSEQAWCERLDAPLTFVLRP